MKEGIFESGLPASMGGDRFLLVFRNVLVGKDACVSIKTGRSKDDSFGCVVVNRKKLIAFLSRPLDELDVETVYKSGVRRI